MVVSVAFVGAIVVAGYIARHLIGARERHEPRFATSFAVEAKVTTRDGKCTSLYDATVEDLTPGGAGLRSAQRIDPGSRIEMTLVLENARVPIRGRLAHRRKAKTSSGETHFWGVAFDPFGQENQVAIAEFCQRHGSMRAERRTSARMRTVSAIRRHLPVLHLPYVSSIGSAKYASTGVRVRNAFVRFIEHPQKLLRVPHGASRTTSTANGTVADHTLSNYEDTLMDNRVASTQLDTRTRQPSAPTLLSVLGANAKIEGRFEVEESIEVQCEIAGELFVGGTLVIGERGRVTADVATVDAVISGVYKGNLRASGSVEIAPTGRVSGTIESHELTISKGAIFTGTIAHVERSQDQPLLSEPLVSDKANTLVDVEKPIPVSRLIELDATNSAQSPTLGRTLGMS